MKYLIIVLMFICATFAQETRTVELDKSMSIQVTDLEDGWTIYKVGPRKYLKYKFNIDEPEGFKYITKKGDTTEFEKIMKKEKTIYYFAMMFDHLKYWNSYIKDTISIIADSSTIGNCIDDAIYSWTIITQACYRECNSYIQQSEMIESRSGQTINKMALTKLLGTMSKLADGINFLNMANSTLVTEKKQHDIYMSDRAYDNKELMNTIETNWADVICPTRIK